MDISRGIRWPAGADIRHYSWLVLKAHSRNNAGTVTLASTDPQDTPIINFNSYTDGGDLDLQASYEGVLEARQIFQDVIPIGGNFHRSHSRTVRPERGGLEELDPNQRMGPPCELLSTHWPDQRHAALCVGLLVQSQGNYGPARRRRQCLPPDPGFLHRRCRVYGFGEGRGGYHPGCAELLNLSRSVPFTLLSLLTLYSFLLVVGDCT